MKARTSWQIMRDTVHALFIRELRTRFGSNRLGYFWALAEPAGQAAIMVALFSTIGRHSLSGVPVALFMLSGILPLKLFSKLLTQLSAAVQANKGLLGYRQVAPIDPLITRLIIELVTFLIVYVLLLVVLAWMGMRVLPDDFLRLLSASLLMVIVAAGLGMIFCVTQLYWDDVTKLINLIMTPMMFISGVFYSATMIPEQYWYLFSWNPLFHAIELARDAFFASYSTPVGSWYYLGAFALVTQAMGLMLYRTNHQRFVAS